MNDSFEQAPFHTNPSPPPTDISPLPASRLPDTLESTQPAQRRQMTAHTGNAIRGLPVKPDPLDPKDGTVCQLRLSYDDVTNATRFSYKNLWRSYEQCAIPATTGPHL